MKKITLALFAAFAAISLNAQTFTEGKVTTKISYPDLEDQPGLLAMLPREIVSYYKNGKARIDQPGAMGSKTTILVDDKKKETATYIDAMGQKFVMTSKEADIKKENARDLEATVTIGTETKTIAGYTCKKATIKYKDGEEGELWFAPELSKGASSSWNQKFKGVDGMMMEFSTTRPSQMGPMTIKMTVTEVSKEKVDDSMFKAPEGEYKKVTAEDLAKMYGK